MSFQTAQLGRANGPVTLKGHTDQFAVSGFGMSVTVPTAGDVGEVSHGKPEWAFSVRIDDLRNGSPEILDAVALGYPATVALHFVTKLGTEYLTLKLGSVTVTSSDTEPTGATTRDAVAESVTLQMVLGTLPGDLGNTFEADYWDVNAIGGRSAEVTETWSPATSAGEPAAKMIYEEHGPTPKSPIDGSQVTTFSALQPKVGELGDATVTMPISTTGGVVFKSIASALQYTVYPSASFSLYESVNKATLTLVDRYQYKNAQIHSVSIVGDVASVEFGAGSVTWSSGSDSRTFTPTR